MQFIWTEKQPGLIKTVRYTVWIICSYWGKTEILMFTSPPPLFHYNVFDEDVTLLCFIISDCEGDECIRGQTPPSSPLSASPSSSVVVKSQQPPQEFLGQFTQVSSPNSGDRKHRDASAVLPFIGLTGSKSHSVTLTTNTSPPLQIVK